MKTVRKALACLTLVFAAIGAGTPYAYAASYDSLEGVDGLDVDHNQFFAEINKINNAWISIAGYQAKNYSALPIN